MGVPNSILENLNPQQQKACQHFKGPALVVAGPGSGKTRVLTRRIAYLIGECGVAPENILAVTFTNKAANEMKERVDRILSPVTSHLSSATHHPSLGTFHSTCARILRRSGKHIGIDPSFVIFDTGDSRTLIRQVTKELNIDKTGASPAAVGNAISSAKSELITPAEYQRFANTPFQEKAAQIYPVYEKKLRAQQALDFDDLINQVIRLFREVPQVLEQYQDLWQYLLVDEYQDTNRAQYVFAKLLASKYQNIFAVGDMSQAIYSFRGADFRNILKFEKDYPNTKIYYLEQNYRSTPQILKAATHLIVNNNTHIPLELRAAGADNGPPLRVYEAIDEEDEAEFVIRGLRSQGLSTLEDGKSAVLYRTNAQSRALEEALIRAGISYRLVGGTRFYERAEVKDVLAYLRLVLNPLDTVAEERALKIGKRRFEAFRLFLSSLTPLNSLTPLEMIDKVLTATTYLEKLEASGEDEDLYRVENVKELRSVAARFDNLADFLENVALMESEVSSRKGNRFYTPPVGALRATPVSHGARAEHALPLQEHGIEPVTLMTLHASKGLEFKNVYMVGMEEGLFPHSRALSSRDELEEERRLCYVGITRAMRNLTFTYTSNRLYFGSYTSSMPSRFLAEIPDHLLQLL
ncbi:MAG: UvrD-helicase domain-containing protein [bacterium]